MSSMSNIPSSTSVSTSEQPRFGAGWTFQNKGLTFYYLAFFFLRGICHRIWMGSAKGLLLVGKNVSIRYPKNLHLGKNVIIEDGAFIGSRCIVVEGAHIGKKAVLGAGVTITGSSKIIDVSGPTPIEYIGYVPENSVVIPGTIQKQFAAGSYGVPCALIIGKRKESTDLKTSLNQALRENNVVV